MLTRKRERFARVARYFFSSFVLIKTESTKTKLTKTKLTKTKLAKTKLTKTESTKTKFLRNRFQIVEVVFEEIERWQFHNIYLREKYSKANLKSVGASTSLELLAFRSLGEAVEGTPII